MNNIHGFKDLKRVEKENGMDEYLENIVKKTGSSLAMGISFGAGALLSFYVLKHYLMSNTA